MKRFKVNSLIAISMVVALLFTGCTPDLTGMELFPDEEKEVVQTEWNFTPGEDFYGYTNAQYLSTLEFDPDYGSAGSFVEAQKLVDEQCKEIIREIANGNPSSYEKGSNEELIYKYYWQICEASSTGEGMMTEEEYEWVKDQIALIQNAENIDEFLQVVSEIDKTFGICFWGNTDITPGFEDSSRETIYYGQFRIFNADVEYLARGDYGASTVYNVIKDSLDKIGVSKDEAEQRANDVTYMAIDIAKYSMIDACEDMDEDMKNTTRYTKEEFDSLMPNIGYDGFVKSFTGRTNISTDIYVLDSEQLSYIDSILTDENLQMWKDLYTSFVMQDISSFLPISVVGISEVWDTDELAINYVEGNLSNQVGEEYAARYLDQETIDDVYAMVESMINQYRVLINGSSYSSEAKNIMLRKLDNIDINVGAKEPHEVNPSDSNLVGNTVFESYINFNKYNAELSLARVGSISDRDGFAFMPPQTVNACYIPYFNSINIPLAIINAPFYSPDNTYAQNLGGLGVVIGHEISHGFDNSGIKYDEYGNYKPDRFPADDVSMFESLQQRTIDYYSGYRVLNYYNVDGEQTLGENLADISGLQCALNLVSTDQDIRDVLESFSRAFACLELNTSAVMQLRNDVHSPDRVRINACVALMDEFYEVYDVSEGDSMYVSPENRFKRW